MSTGLLKGGGGLKKEVCYDAFFTKDLGLTREPKNLKLTFICRIALT